MKHILALLFFSLSLFANIPSGAYYAQDHRIAKVGNGTTITYLVDPNTPYARVIHESRDNGTEIDYSYGLRLLGDGSHSFLTDDNRGQVMLMLSSFLLYLSIRKYTGI